MDEVRIGLGLQVVRRRFDFMKAFLKDEAKQDSMVNAYVAAVFQMVLTCEKINHADVTRTLKARMASQVRFSTTVMVRTTAEQFVLSDLQEQQIQAWST